MRGPAWDYSRGLREQRLWDDHAQFSDRLVADGRILLGGPIEDADPQVVALLAMRLPYAAAAHELFANDPWVEARILAVRDVRLWTIWLRPGS